MYHVSIYAMSRYFFESTVSNLLPERPCAAPDGRLRPGFGRGHREEGEGEDGRWRRGGGRDRVPRRVDGVRPRIHRDAQVESMATYLPSLVIERLSYLVW